MDSDDSIFETLARIRRADTRMILSKKNQSKCDNNYSLDHYGENPFSHLMKLRVLRNEPTEAKYISLGG